MKEDETIDICFLIHAQCAADQQGVHGEPADCGEEGREVEEGSEGGERVSGREEETSVTKRGGERGFQGHWNQDCSSE